MSLSGDAQRSLRVHLGAAAMLMGFLWLALRGGFTQSLASSLSSLGPVLVVSTAAGALLWETFRGPVPGRDTRVTLALGLAVIATTMPVIDEWARARTTGSYIGGLLPYSDGHGYHEGALHLLHDGVLSGWDSRRPLNPAFLAGRIALVGGSFRFAILLEAALVGWSAFLAGRAIAQDLGFAAGALTYAVLMLFGARWMPTVWTEPLGLTLGALSFAALWHAARTRSPAAMAAGFALLALAQNARAGAVFVVPLLLWWASGLPRAEGQRRWTLLVSSIVGIAVAWACNRAVTTFNGGSAKAGHGAFSYTLYGLTHGGTNWIAAFRDHPELYSLLAKDDAAAADVAYSLAMDELRRHPTGLLVGLWVGVRDFIDAWGEALSAGLLSHHRVLQWLYFLAIVAGVAWLIRRLRRIHGNDPALSMVLTACVGMLASIPVIYSDGGERVFAATIPFLGALAALVACSLRRQPMSTGGHANRWVLSAAFGASVVLVALFGPTLGRRTLGGWSSGAPPSCRDGDVGMFVIGTPASPKLAIVGNGASTFVPTITERDFVASVSTVPGGRSPNPTSDTLAELPADTTLAIAYDLRSHSSKLVAGPLGWLRDGDAVPICTHLSGTDLYRVVSP